MSNRRSAVSNQRVNPPIMPLAKGWEEGFEAGFTLVELMITMVVFVLVIAAASQVFTGLLTQFKQQSKIAETNVEGIVGLEILRRDIEQAGYGLPWVVPAGVNYQEAVTGYNDSPSNPPRAILSGNGTGFNGSDELIIKATNVARSEASSKWTYLSTGNVVKEWTPDTERLVTSDRVIVLSPGTTRTLVLSGTSFTTRYRADTDPDSLFDASFAPPDNTETRIVYGITPPASPVATALRMPFNRADYYISTSNVPQMCASNTGVFSKNVISQADGSRADNLPLLDCVADMQVDFWLDTDGDGDIDWPPSDNISALTAQQIRDRVKEVRVYIVAHEGQRDVNYDFSMGGTKEFLSATEVLDTNSRTINFVNLKTQIGNPDYKYYRWKLYTIVVKPTNLR